MNKPLSVYKTGSSLILERSNDVDIIYYYATQEEANEALRKYLHDRKCDVHFRAISSVDKTFIGAYIRPYMELLEGEEIPAIKKYNLLEHKDEYVEKVKRLINSLPHTSKLWYHIYLGLSILRRNKLYITKEQLAKAQDIHDKGIDEDTFKYCVETLELLN